MTAENQAVPSHEFRSGAPKNLNCCGAFCQEDVTAQPAITAGEEHSSNANGGLIFGEKFNLSLTGP